MNAEEKRLGESRLRSKHWKRWGPYVSERAWGTVREDYSSSGAAWEHLPFEHSHLKAYRWDEDGIAGFCDRHQLLCFALGLWNGKDPILKERLYGLTANQGNYGEDVKECYFYLDSTPSHSYQKFLYKYPQREFPYRQLLSENQKRDKSQPEFELTDTGIFDNKEYFDVYVEYAKVDEEDILIRIEIANRAAATATIHILPHLWFRNTWSWTVDAEKPRLDLVSIIPGVASIEANGLYFGKRYLHCENASDILFTENETNNQQLYQAPNSSGFAKDGIGEFVVRNRTEAVNPEKTGTKAAAHYLLEIGAGESAFIRLRLSDKEFSGTGEKSSKNIFKDFDKVFEQRKAEADEFYAEIIPESLSTGARNVMRQSLAGMLWSKQYYHYEVKAWLEGDAVHPPPPENRKEGRNAEWPHLFNADIISMPDKWEYPWYAAWDLAFH